MESNRQYVMLLHLSLLSGLVIPGIGWVVPLVMWLVKKDDPVVDRHGKIVVNWMLSALIYSIIGAILMVIGIGVLILIAIGVCNLIFSIIGAIKAADGEAWPYPLSIQFLKERTVI
ncbi:DUF4870 domain-containing protein [Aliidiomarina indica]|uniref:DUF4870 domain-containing protein n=1 Tax=Aliidiomarina indica TaxID=2749147 RepID=UPI00188F77D6|nr:DUF4870 domain-containing protein [Aliidiomarina indica]